MEPTKLWLDPNNKLLSDDTIQEKSKEWDADTWEAFLLATVDRDMARQETVSDDYDDLLEQETHTIWFEHCRLPRAIQSSVDQSVRSLDLVPRKVVRGIYWRDLPQTKIAKKLKISQSLVCRQKNLSHRKIKDLLERDVITAAYLIGGSANLASGIKTWGQELCEVYQQELNGSYLK